MSNKINEINWKKEQLWKGCILASIAHAIMVAHYPELSNEHSWDGINYNVQDSEGVRGTITFGLEYCVGAFCNYNSDRIKMLKNTSMVEDYFRSVPKEIINIAENEALQYLLEEVDGENIPIITTMFWGGREKFFGIDSLEDMYYNGVFLLKRQLLEFENAIESWIEYYDMSSQQSELLKAIFNRKIYTKSQNIILSKEDIQKIGTIDANGLMESKQSFKEIGIILEY